MRGVITKIDLMTHPFIVIHGFGLKLYLQALVAPGKSTFLDLIRENLAEPVSAQHEHFYEQMHQLIDFEVNLASIYTRLKEKHSDNPIAVKFFETLEEHEEDHAEMLEIIKVEVARKEAWHTIKPVKKEFLDNANTTIEKIKNRLENEGDLNQSLEFVKELETIEEKIVFDSLLLFFSLIQSPFFDTVCRFVPSFYDHYSYVHSMIDVLKNQDNEAA